MGRRLIYLEASPGVVQVHCHECGFVGMRVRPENAQAVADRHRAQVHPRQETYAASKRRHRALNT